MFRVACCDDEQGMLDVLYNYVQRWSVERQIPAATALFTDAIELFREFECERKVDLLFMDIGFTNANGFDVAKMIRDRNKSVIIVFITGTPQYAVDGYHIDAFRYLLKPVAYESLAEVLDSAHTKVKAHETQTIILRDQSGIVSVAVDDIVYIESIPHYIVVHLVNGKTYKCRGTIREQTQRLHGTGILQCHRAFLVNASHIHRLQAGSVQMKTGETIPVSRSMRKSALSQLMRKAGGTL